MESSAQNGKSCDSKGIKGRKKRREETSLPRNDASSSNGGRSSDSSSSTHHPHSSRNENDGDCVSSHAASVEGEEEEERSSSPSTSKRYDEDALPVPLEDVELLTGGIDEDDDRRVEFPWDEEARRARVAPRPIRFQETVTNLSCHPSQNFVACAHLDGVVSVNRFCLDAKRRMEEEEEEEGEKKEKEEKEELEEAATAGKGKHGEEVFSYLDYEEACRVVVFNRDGSKLFTASAGCDLTLHDLESEEVDRRFSDHATHAAHADPIYALCQLSPSLVASGDDAGVIKLWDLRQPKSLFTLKENSDFISSLLNGDADENSSRRLLATSGDGTLTAFNLRQRKVELKSETFDSELLCAAPIRNRSKLVTGNGNGVCDIFNWDEWGYFADKMPVSLGSSLDAMVSVTDNVVAVAGLSGQIHAIHLNPNRHLGRIGVHHHLVSCEDDDDDATDGDGVVAGGSGTSNGGSGSKTTTTTTSPIDSLALSHDGDILTSCGHDNVVRFWSVAHLREVNPENLPKRKKSWAQKTLLDPDANRDAFYHDLAGYDKVEEEEEEEDDDDSSDDDDDSKSEKKKLEAIEEAEEDESDDDDDEDDDDGDTAPPPTKKKHR